MLAANAMGEEPVTFPDVEWEVRTPAEVGLDVAKLQELSAMVGGAGAIVRNGYMVYTWGDQNARSPTQAWASASKAVVSTMLFFAINEGRLSGPNVRVRTYVQQQFPGEDLIAKDVPMTFRHLANAQSGYVLPEAPGDAYVYNDYAFKLYKYLVFGQLFGVSPTSASAVAAEITAPERLGPLQFQDGSLIAIIKGAPRWNATLRDTARLGWFWLNKGRWKAQQLLPQALFDTYARAQVPANLPRSTSNTPNDYLGLGTDGDTDPNQNPTDPHYGYNWHHNLGTDGTLDVPGAPADLFYAAGNLNKVIAMVPSQKLVAVWRDGPNLTDEQRAAALEKLSSAVVTVVSDLVVASGEPYQWFNLASGQNMYIDRTYRFGSPIPASINGQFTLRTANDDKFSSANATHVSFTVNQASTVYVLYTTVNTTLWSTWLTDANGWSLENYTVPTNLPGAEAARKVRKKTFAAGATVTLNGNGSTNNISSMYNVVVVP